MFGKLLIFALVVLLFVMHPGDDWDAISVILMAIMSVGSLALLALELIDFVDRRRG